MREAEAKKTEALKQKQKKEAALKQKKKKKKGAETEKKEERCGTEAERKRGLEQRIFQHLFSFKSSQKNYGEFVYVEFNF